jgi:hypothetical protein
MSAMCQKLTSRARAGVERDPRAGKVGQGPVVPKASPNRARGATRNHMRPGQIGRGR